MLPQGRSSDCAYCAFSSSRKNKAFERIGPAGVRWARDAAHPKNSAFAHKPGKDEAADVRQELKEHAKYFMYGETHRSNDQLLSAFVRALAGNQSDSVL